ncbi:ATP-binding response regulator [Desulforegula conservatrix]|uniref:ATP-binding response regulator n=1 Tax=Desulforegula conservatrix TaxID=153026 RepID=UPI00048840DE|nr:hybrid sensor histidine kinase/response regulator [Desulforegula conservatrix]
MNCNITKILIVDDVMINLVILEAMLKSQDVEIHKATSGEQAINLIARNDFALMLLDVHMPEMDGFDTLEKISNFYPQKIIPTILVTATITDILSVVKGYEKGAVDYLVKPLNPVIVKKKVQVFIDLHKQKKHQENLATELQKEIIIREKTEQELRKSKHQFESLSQNSPDIIYTLDKNGRINYVNPAWTEILGHSKSEIMGRDFTDFAKPKDIQRYRRLFRQIRDEGKTFRDISGELIHKDGTIRHFILSGAQNQNDKDSAPGMVGLLKDTTTQQKLQAQLLHSQKMEAIGNMAGGIAHDFNNLLQAIQGYAELLLITKASGKKQNQEISEIKKAAQRGAALTQQLLTFSRKAEINFRPVNLNLEVESVHKLLLRTIPKMIEIKLDLQKDISYISADPGRIEQIIMNLGVNARDAVNDEGTINILTSNVILDDKFCRENTGSVPGEYVLFEISDSGEGIPEEVVEHIFEPFFTTKEAGKGTGLGLAIVYGIVKNHQGYITCQSRLGVGTTFRIYFPTIKCTEAFEEKPRELQTKGGTETILLVDDEEQVLQIGSRVLSKFGYNVLQASNGDEAIEIYKNKFSEIKIIILDMIMPKMGGRQCLNEILKINPEAKVIISSGFSADKTDESDISRLIKGFIHKPYEVKYLLATIREVLDGPVCSESDSLYN